jgi:flagellar motor switch protein FliN/FliY
MAESQPPPPPPPEGALPQSDIDALINDAGAAARSSAQVPSTGAASSTKDPAAAPAGDEFAADSASIEELLRQANFEDPASLGLGGPPGSPPAPDAPGFEFPSLQQVVQDAQASSIDLLRDVELNVKIELGRSRMLVEDVLRLSEGSVVELDKLAGDPVDVFVNDRLVARGEVLVLNDNFCVRVNEIVAGVKEEGL